MNADHLPRSLTRRCATALAAAAVLSTPMLASAQSGDMSPEQTYRQERAACMAGHTTQSRADCLYEARSVLRDARLGKLQSADADTLARNAMARCDGVPGDARTSCERLVRGEGERLGSVEEGAIVMWVAEAPADASVAAYSAAPMDMPAGDPASAQAPSWSSTASTGTTADANPTASVVSPSEPMAASVSEPMAAGTVSSPSQPMSTLQEPVSEPVVEPMTEPMAQPVTEPAPQQESAPASTEPQPAAADPLATPDTTKMPAEIQGEPVRPSSALPQ